MKSAKSEFNQYFLEFEDCWSINAAFFIKYNNRSKKTVINVFLREMFFVIK